MFRKSIIFVSAIIWFACEPGEEFLPANPLDPENENYISPQVTFTSAPNEGATLSTSTIMFVWDGNEPGMSYRYAFDGNWSSWENEKKSITIDDIDEGLHSIAAQSSYSTGDTSNVISVNFNVNAVLGPSLLFYPRKHVAFFGETVTFQILAEEVIGLSGAEFKIDYDPSMFQIESVTQGALFQSGTQSIFHVDYNNAQGSFSVLTAILDATTPSVDGTGVLAEVVVKLLNQGTNNLSFGSTNKLRDPDNIEIAIREKIGGIVIAQ